ncbi:Arf/Sar family, other [Trypanosoma conorhini]|uniref:Arf/Sar family, other n=1 Tax=Trypanosoma conorhini TaxID=83891 RepID=A0A422NL00_9TRYP|nr:Arf/Sar family, other [Trypanosoma conorhini]RNF06172.1 Arf/Sar family, other [Trypanosoma conorhini]
MFTFAWGLYSALFTDRTYKVLIVGLESSGKTTLLEQVKCVYATSSSAASQGRLGVESSVMPTPAPVSVMKAKCIRPTVGLNMNRITHRTIPARLSASSRHGSLSHDKDDDVPSSRSTNSLSSSVPLSAFTPVTTRLMLWDVGGSMLKLWANYFASCHGVIFVVDSTIGTTAAAGASASAPLAAVAEVGEQAAASSGRSCVSSLDAENLSSTFSPDGIVTSLVSAPCAAAERAESPAPHQMEEKRRSVQRQAFARNAAVLRALFRHPLLTNAPLLILSNKADVVGHCPLAEVQEALGLVELALMHELYDRGSASGKSHSAATADDADEFFDPLPVSDHPRNGVDAAGTSGIGSKIMRLAEVSALDGSGVREAMDWLVFQMRDNAREVVENDK